MATKKKSKAAAGKKIKSGKPSKTKTAAPKGKKAKSAPKKAARPAKKVAAKKAVAKKPAAKKSAKKPAAKAKATVEKAPVELSHGKDLYLIPVKGEIHPARIEERNKFEKNYRHDEEVALHQEQQRVKTAMATRKNMKRIFPGRQS